MVSVKNKQKNLHHFPAQRKLPRKLGYQGSYALLSRKSDQIVLSRLSTDKKLVVGLEEGKEDATFPAYSLSQTSSWKS